MVLNTGRYDIICIERDAGIALIPGRKLVLVVKSLIRFLQGPERR